MFNKWKLYEMLGYGVHHEAVRRFHESKARVKVVCAPRRTTKSYSAAKDVLPDLLQDRAKVWVVGSNYGLAEKEFSYILNDLVIEREKIGMPKPMVCQTNARSGSLYIQWQYYPQNPEGSRLGSILQGKSCDNPESLLGEALDAVIYSEAAQISRGIRERYIQPTLITKKGREIIPTTPDSSAEWVHELWTMGQEGRFPYIESFYWDRTANPTYDLEEFERAKEFYGADNPVFREQYLGEWVFYGGLVYPLYRPESHVIEPFDIPHNWPVVRAIDFGHRDPFAVLWGAVGPHNEIYIFREYYSTEGRSIREHASIIKTYSRTERIIQTVGDPQAKQSIEDLCYEGVACDSANHDRQAGRMRVMEYLLQTEDGTPAYPEKLRLKQKYPKMYIFSTCKELQRELRYYRWREGLSKEGDKERTEGDDHLADCLRYLCMTRPSPYKSLSKTPSGSFMGWLSRMKTQRSESAYIGR